MGVREYKMGVREYKMGKVGIKKKSNFIIYVFGAPVRALAHLYVFFEVQLYACKSGFTCLYAINIIIILL